MPLDALAQQLLLRQPKPIGTPIDLPQTDPNPTLGKQAFEGGIDTLLGTLGVGPDTRANKIGQMVGMAPPLMRMGSKVLKNVGGVWKILDEAEQTTALNRIKPFEETQVMRSPEDLASVAPPTVTRPPPPPVSYQNNGRMAAQSRSKLNTTMVADIRKKASMGASPTDLAKEYGIGVNSVSEIIRRDSWAWVK